MQFSSKPPFNDDPSPWRQRMTNKRISATDHGAKMSSQKRGVAARALAYAYNPRPEFERPQHNPTNPILSNYREFRGEDLPFTTPGNWAYNLLHPSHEAWSYANSEQVKHAYKVLTRLERMSR